MYQLSINIIKTTVFMNVFHRILLNMLVFEEQRCVIVALVNISIYLYMNIDASILDFLLTICCLQNISSNFSLCQTRMQLTHFAVLSSSPWRRHVNSGPGIPRKSVLYPTNFFYSSIQSSSDQQYCSLLFLRVSVYNFYSIQSAFYAFKLVNVLSLTVNIQESNMRFFSIKDEMTIDHQFYDWFW